jgi:outer membrane cobalamin receptor
MPSRTLPYARSRPRGFLLLAALLAGGCATAPGADGTAPNPREGQIITREDIARTSARDAWEALRMAGTHLSIQFPREGSPARVTHRGVDSFVLSPEVLLVVDGTHMGSLEALRDIRATNIDYMQILPARVAVVKYGTAGGNGVVVVRTGVPPSRRDPGA